MSPTTSFFIYSYFSRKLLLNVDLIDIARINHEHIFFR